MLFFLARRIVTIGLCAGSFWLGMKTESIFDPVTALDGAVTECPPQKDTANAD